MVTIIAVLMVSVALSLLIWGVASVVPPVSRVVARSFWCPFRARNVTVDFEEEAWDGTRFEVSRCTAFMPPTAITCQKLCLQLEEFPGSKQGQVA